MVELAAEIAKSGAISFATRANKGIDTVNLQSIDTAQQLSSEAAAYETANPGDTNFHDDSKLVPYFSLFLVGNHISISGQYRCQLATEAPRLCLKYQFFRGANYIWRFGKSNNNCEEFKELQEFKETASSGHGSDH